MPPGKLTIAVSISGLDPSGGAGLLADARTFEEHGLRAMGVVTALTLQNSTVCEGFASPEPAVVERQLHLLFDDFAVAAVKIGLLGSKAITAAVGRALAGRGLPVVLDPVLGTTVSGPLVALDALPELRRLLPGCSLVTPNLDEARLLCGGSAPEAIEDLDGMRAAAAALRGLGAPAVLLKGGHLAGDAVDLLDDGKQVIELRAARLPGAAVHGTGCILSSAIAARLATGASLLGAVQGGKQFLWRKLRQTLPLGHGLRYLP